MSYRAALPWFRALRAFAAAFLAILTCFPAAAEEPALRFETGGLAVTVSAAGPGTPGAVRVAVTPAAGPAAEEDAGLNRVVLGGCRAHWNPSDSTLTLTHAEGGRWVGRITPLTQTGRMGVPGVEFAWRAAPGEALYGLGERFDSFNLAGRSVEMWIVDEPGQGDGGASYFVTPVLYSSAGYGLWSDTNPEGAFDLNAADDGWHRYARSGQEASVVVAFAPAVLGLVEQRTRMIGGLVPAPEWAYDPWISKNSYETQAEGEAAIDGMRQRDLPFGVIVLEAWKGTSETGEFNRFSQERWPEIDAFLDRCAREGVKVVLWQVPILHPSSSWFAEARDKGYLVVDPSGEVSLREEWMAGFGNIDFYQPEAVAFWKDMLRPVVRRGVHGFKADDGEAIKPDDVLGDGVPGWKAHNDWSAAYNVATYELFEEEGVEGMIWARSGSVGIEKAPAKWAGDQGAEWGQMRRLVSAGLSASLSGMPYWSHDIGGYYGACTPELYIRWLQFGAFSPFMQFHGIEPREPWHFGEAAVDAYRTLARLRLTLKPHLVDLGAEAARTGMPIMRPMFFSTGEHPKPGLVDQYTLGSDIVVAPVFEQGLSGRRVELPEGRWLYAGAPVVYDGPGVFRVPIGLDDPPIFLRQGAELRVALAEGQPILAGTGEGETRLITVSPEALWGRPAAIANLDVPLRGNPATGEQAATFRSETGQAVALHTWFEGQDRTAADSVVYRPDVEPGGMVEASLTPASITDAIGHIQRYALTLPTASGAQGATLIEGLVDWRDPVVVEVDDPYLDVVANGAVEIAGRVTNRSAHACAVVLHLAGEGIGMDRRALPRFALEPGESAEWSRRVLVPESPQAIGDVRVDVRAKVEGVTVSTAEAALVRSPRWFLVGPFPAESMAAGFGATTSAEWQFGPEARIAYGGVTRQWRTLSKEAVAEMDGVDFNAVYGETENAFVYAMAIVHSTTDQPAQVRVGSDDSLTLWVNGDMLVAEDYSRAAEPDSDVVDVQLKQGDNRILIKVAQGQHGWGMRFRLTGPDGAPIEGVRDGGVASEYPLLEPQAE
ncbi:MAG: TIM-barrel domain-containing protein [Planctomycetota bacterium]